MSDISCDIFVRITEFKIENEEKYKTFKDKYNG